MGMLQTPFLKDIVADAFDTLETPIKLIYTSVWFAIVVPLISKNVAKPSPTSLEILAYYAESAYLAGFPLLQLFVSVIHPRLFRAAPTATVQELVDWDMVPSRPKMEFLPLMATSMYCAIGIIWSWLKMSYLYFKSHDKSR
jgi:alpha-1,3-glucosyltransferase